MATSNLQRFLLLTSFLLCECTDRGTVTARAAEVSIQDVRQSWHDHSLKISSFDSVYAVTKQTVGLQPGDDPMAPPPESGNVQITTTVFTESYEISFAASLPKIAFACTKEPGVRPSQLSFTGDGNNQRICFNGKESKLLLSGPHFPMGEVHTGKVVDELGRTIDLLGIWLSYSPLRFFDFNPYYDFNTLRISNPRASWNGASTIELAVSGKKGSDITGVLHLDPATHRVACLRHVVKGLARRELELQYQTHEESNYFLSGWMYREVDSDGLPTGESKGKLVSLTVNDRLADRTFEIEFPPRTHVIRDGGASIQEGDELRPIEPKELGRIDKLEPAESSRYN